MNSPSLENILRLYARLVLRHAQTKLHMSPEQYAHLAAALYERAPCSFLVFGCGLDSPFWSEINSAGQTVFLEDQQDWQQPFENCGINVVSVSYDSKINVWLEDI